MKMSKQEKKELKLKEKEAARQTQIENIINYNRVVAIELANRAKEKKPNPDAFICLQNVNKIYDNLVQAVFDFSLDVHKNEFIVLVGPSGCGKSTTLRMIAGLEEITAGNLFIDGKYANVLPPKNRDISMVFQSYALYPHMSVYNNMAFAMQIRPYDIPLVDANNAPVMGVDKNKLAELNAKLAEINKQIANVESYKYDGSTVSDVLSPLYQQKESLEKEIFTLNNNPTQLTELRKYNKEEIDEYVQEAAKILQIQDYLDRKPRELSGGQRQRVALGRAIVKKAKLFLMDEPLSNLDAKLRVSMRSEIKRIHKSIGATTIYVTHDQTEAMTMADRIVIMNKGYIQQIGAPQDIYNKPANVFVATFIGSPAMNVYDVTVEKGLIKFADDFSLKIDSKDEELIKAAIEKKIREITEFELGGLESERQKQILVNRETLILDMKNHKAKGKQIGLPDPLDNIVLTDDEEKICKDLFNKKLEELLAKKVKYQEMLANKSYQVKFGIRPENVFVSGASLEKDVKPSEEKDFKVTISELLGNEYYLHGDLGGKDFVLKASSSVTVKEGESAKIIFDKSKMHIFDAIDDKLIY